MIACVECNVPTEVVEDYRTGDCICTACGLVLDSHRLECTDFTHSGVLEDVLASQIIRDCPRSLLHAGSNASVRSGIQACCTIEVCAAKAMLPDAVISHAKQLWSDVSCRKLCRGHIRAGLTAACVYIACKMAQFPRSKSTLAAVFGLSVDVISKGIKLYMKLSKPRLEHSALLSAATDSKDLLGKCTSECPFISEEDMRSVTAKARIADAELSQSGVLEGKTPQVRAAAAISIALQRMGLKGGDQLHTALHISQYTLSRTLSLVRSHTSIA